MRLAGATRQTFRPGWRIDTRDGFVALAFLTGVKRMGTQKCHEQWRSRCPATGESGFLRVVARCELLRGAEGNTVLQVPDEVASRANASENGLRMDWPDRVLHLPGGFRRKKNQLPMFSGSGRLPPLLCVVTPNRSLSAQWKRYAG